MKTQTKQSHTPGPWTWARVKESILVISTKGTKENPTGLPAMIPDKWLMSTEEKEANARLIAAAPSMLNALDEILGQSVDHDEYGEIEMRERLREIAFLARRAIARAEGGK